MCPWIIYFKSSLNCSAIIECQGSVARGHFSGERTSLQQRKRAGQKRTKVRKDMVLLVWWVQEWLFFFFSFCLSVFSFSIVGCGLKKEMQRAWTLMSIRLRLEYGFNTNIEKMRKPLTLNLRFLICKIGWEWWYPLPGCWEGQHGARHTSGPQHNQSDLLTSCLNRRKHSWPGGRHMGSGMCWSHLSCSLALWLHNIRPRESTSTVWASFFLTRKMGTKLPLLKVPHRHLVPVSVPYYYYPIPQDWQAQNQAGWTGKKLELEAAPYPSSYLWHF